MEDLTDFIRCLRRIEATHEALGWDDDARPSLYALDRTDGRVKALKLGIGDSIWDLGPPGVVMQGLAKYVSLNAATMLKPFGGRGWQWYGLALVTEVWAASEHGPGGYQQLLVDADARAIHTRTDKRSARVVYGMTREMQPGFLIRYEDSPAEVIDRSDASFPGGILHGLSSLVATIDELLDHAS